MPAWMAKAMLRLGMLAEITVVGRTSGVERQVWVDMGTAPGGGSFVAFSSWTS